MLLDTGTSNTIFDAAHRAELGIPSGRIDADGPMLAGSIELFKGPAFRIGSLTVRPEGDIGCADLHRLADGLGEKIDGVLGMDVLRSLVFSIDFDQGRLRFYNAAIPTPGRRVQLIWDDQIASPVPLVSVQVGTAPPEGMRVDTTSDGPVVGPDGVLLTMGCLFMLDTGCVRSISGAVNSATRGKMAGDVLLGYDERLFRARDISLEGYAHRGLIFGQLPDNMLGLAYLSRYFVLFDFPNSALYLRPGKMYSDDVIVYDLSGLAVERRGPATIVAFAERGEPGDAAGLREGDTILAVDGRDTGGMSLFAVRRRLRLEGRHVLDIRRDGQQRRAVLALDKVRRDDPAAKEPIHRWALLVGVDRVRRDKYAGDDQRALAAQLIDNGFERDHVFLLREQAKDGTHVPCKANIEQQLELLLKRVKPEDTLIVAFSGHGVLTKNAAYLCPSGGNPDDADSLISLDGLLGKLARSPATLKLVLLDACPGDARPGDDGGRADDPRQLPTALARMEPPPGVLLLTSCSDGETPKRDSDLRYGVLMHFVLEGLQGGADADNNRHVSIRELSSYVARKTQSHVPGKLNASQRPFLHCNVKASGLDSDLFALTKPGETITNTIGMKLVVIPDGEFKMGGHESVAELEQALGEMRDSGKPEWIAAENPQHTVRIAKSFYMGVHEVTKAQFARFVDAENYETDAERSGKGAWRPSEKDSELARQLAYTWRTCGFEQADDHPVVSVSFNDATAFCAWLSKLEGNTYRLPTEAEWEYACRAGTSTRFYNGDDPEGLVEIGNVADGTAFEKLEKLSFPAPEQGRDGYVFTAQVGRFRPNAFGLYDMLGNVDEWCADWYDPDYYANAPRDDPKGPASGFMRVLRGGGWRSPPIGCRSAMRAFGSRGFRQRDIGFRVVRVR